MRADLTESRLVADDQVGIRLVDDVPDFVVGKFEIDGKQCCSASQGGEIHDVMVGTIGGNDAKPAARS